MTTFDNQSFDHTERFEPKSQSLQDLKTARAYAVKYYNERLSGVGSGSATFYKPFAAPQDFVMGKHAAYSINLNLVEYYSEDNQNPLTVMGEDPQTTAEAVVLEQEIFNALV